MWSEGIADVGRSWGLIVGGLVPFTCMPLMEATEGSAFSRSLILCATRDFCSQETMEVSFAGLQDVLGACFIVSVEYLYALAEG